MTAKVADVLTLKGSEVVTVTPDQSIDTASRILAQKRIGALPVIDEWRRLVGIISERDIVRGLALHGNAVLFLTVGELMTRGVKTCSPEELIVSLMETMTNRRIRHLPVLRDGRLCGIVSIGDVVKQRLTEAQLELDQLRMYIAS